MTDRVCPSCFLCPITHLIMRDPHCCTDGHSYEKEAISKWLQSHATSPLTRQHLESKALFPNRALSGAIEEWEKRTKIAYQEDFGRTYKHLIAPAGLELPLEHKHRSQLDMMKYISTAMQELAEAGVVHGGLAWPGLAARNLLVFSELSVRIDRPSHRTVLGNELPFRWMSPEAIRERRCTEASDVWAMGVTMWEILKGGEMPYAQYKDCRVAQRVCDGTHRLPRPEGCPDGL